MEFRLSLFSDKADNDDDDTGSVASFTQGRIKAQAN